MLRGFQSEGVALSVALVFLCVLLPVEAQAQLAGHNTRGDYGLQSGTLPPPGFYIAPQFYDFSADTLRDANGDRFEVLGGGTVDFQAAIVGGLWVTDTKILGGNYAFAIYPAVTNNALELPVLETESETSTGFADLYIQPFVLGWTSERADFTAGFGFYAPTGEYTAGGDDNLGLGMWGFEVFGGTTVYFDEARAWHFAATAFYETHDNKDGTDIRVGDILTLEGGFGRSFMDGAANAGIAYYAQWKVSDDDFGLGFMPPASPLLDRHRVFGFGPEVTIPLASKRKLFGFLNLRYFWETGARTTLEGDTFLATFTFPIPGIPLE